jgi:hypothetical protein
MSGLTRRQSFEQVSRDVRAVLFTSHLDSWSTPMSIQRTRKRDWN